MNVMNKTVLVTGASRGLGRAIAGAFLGHGARVLVVGRDPQALQETESALIEISGDFELVVLDCRDEEAVTRFIAALPVLDIVVNNAGVAAVRPLLETSTTELRDIFEINVIAAFVIMRESIRRMVRSGGGHIINIASDAALRGIAGMAPYVASKHALLGLGRSVSQELREQGIRVTTFCPGPISTDIFGPGTANPDALPPQQLAETIVHLAALGGQVEVQEVLVQPMPGSRTPKPATRPL